MLLYLVVALLLLTTARAFSVGSFGRKILAGKMSMAGDFYSIVEKVRRGQGFLSELFARDVFEFVETF